MATQDAAYSKLVSELASARRFGMKLDLARMEQALLALGNPQLRIPWRIQVGGTNGKGSTIGFCERILREHGLRTGLFTSPHLVRFSERLRVNGEEISRDGLVKVWAKVAGVCQKFELTFFEQVTVLAAQWFADENVDVGLFEVGMGGRFDATSALSHHVTAVTGVAMDHQQYLGDTLEKIAYEKAGVFHAGKPAIVGVAGEAAAQSTLMRLAKNAGAQVEVVQTADIEIVHRLLDEAGLALGLAGTHQWGNAACAYVATKAWSRLADFRLADAKIARGLHQAGVPGRMERFIWKGLPIILDGAHNPHGMNALVSFLREADLGDLTIMPAIASDKDVAPMLQLLQSVPKSRFVLVRGNHERLSSPETLAGVLETMGGQAVIADSIANALQLARENRPQPGCAVVTGSLFWVGEVRQWLTGEMGDGPELTEALSPPNSNC